MMSMIMNNNNNTFVNVLIKHKPLKFISIIQSK